jgi:hypothetical protein
LSRLDKGSDIEQHYSAALNTKQLVREDKRQMKSTGLMTRHAQENRKQGAASYSEKQWWHWQLWDQQ